MKITEDVRKYAAEQGIAEEEALKEGMEEKVERVRGKGSGGLREGVIPRVLLCQVRYVQVAGDLPIPSEVDFIIMP